MRIISVVDAILGTTVQVDTLDGPIHLRIPEGSQPGQVFRFSGKGLPELGRRHKGDHYVTVHVEIPKKLSREERRLVEEWKKTKGA